MATGLGRDRVQDATSRGPVGAGELELGDRVGADGRIAAQCHSVVGASGGNQGASEYPVGQGTGATQPSAVGLHLLDRHVHAAVEMTGGHPVASASHGGLELLDLGIVRINEVRAADSGQQDRPEGTGPGASGGDHRLQLAGAVAAGRDQDPSAPEGASADLKEEERAVWLVVLELVNEALDGGQALAQSDRLGVIDGLSRGAAEVSGDCLRQHDVECGDARIERVLFHRCLGTSRWKRQVSERTKELGPPVRIWGPSWCWKLKSVHLGSINPNNWLPLLAFRERLIAGEVAPESNTSSVASTEERNETTTARGIRNAVCRPTGAANKQQILDLDPTGMSARAVARQVGTSTSTVKAVCRQAKQPPRRKRRFTDDDLRRAQQLHAEGRTYIEIGLELGFVRDTLKKRLTDGRGSRLSLSLRG